MKKRTFTLCGYTVELWDFGYKQFLYPAFNGNAEFEVTSKGFRELSHYLRTVTYFRNQVMSGTASLTLWNQN